MKKLISFRMLKEMCKYEGMNWCEHPCFSGKGFKCNGKDCPIWKKLTLNDYWSEVLEVDMAEAVNGRPNRRYMF